MSEMRGCADFRAAVASEELCVRCGYRLSEHAPPAAEAEGTMCSGDRLHVWSGQPVHGAPCHCGQTQWRDVRLVEAELARVTALEREMTEAVRIMTQRKDEAERQGAQLATALRQYGQHTDDCELRDRWTKQQRCTCGFEAALAAVRPWEA